MSRLILSVLVVAAICALAFGVVMLGIWPTARPVAPAAGEFGSNKVPALGRLEPYDGIIPISTVPGDRVQAILVPKKVAGKDNWTVAKGEELVILRSKAMQEKEVQLAQAQLASAKKQLAALKASGEAQVKEADLKREGLLADAAGEIVSLELKVGLLQKQYKAAQDSLQRLKDLKGTVPDEDVRKQELAVDSAEVELKSTKPARTGHQEPDPDCQGSRCQDRVPEKEPGTGGSGSRHRIRSAQRGPG